MPAWLRNGFAGCWRLIGRGFRACPRGRLNGPINLNRRRVFRFGSAHHSPRPLRLLGSGGGSCSGSLQLLPRRGDGFAFGGLGELRFGFREDLPRFGNRPLGELDLPFCAAGGFLGLFAPTPGQARLLLGRPPLVHGFRELQTRELNFTQQPVRGGCTPGCFHKLACSLPGAAGEDAHPRAVACQVVQVRAHSAVLSFQRLPALV